jgi:hypothetical protein
MATLDAVYSITVVFILFLVYHFPSHRFEKLFPKSNLFSRTWQETAPEVEPSTKKHAVVESDAPSGSKQKYNKSWWSDEKQFQLERRAIFSKVRTSERRW